MDFDPSSLIASLFVSTIGLGICLYGKKQRRAPQWIAGILLMGFPYVVGGATAIFLIGAAIVAGLWVSVRMGM